MLDRQLWSGASWVDHFVDIVTGTPAWFATRSALLWDDVYLHVAFELYEPNLVATQARRDDPLYLENDVEVFVAGADAYYELEVSALNNVYEVLWIWQDALRPGGHLASRAGFQPGGHRTMRLSGIGDHVHPRGERVGLLDWDLPGLAHTVELEGSLNDPSDRDLGWRAELALPWAGLAAVVDRSSAAVMPGDIWRVECSRFEWNAEDGSRLSESAGWTWSPHGYYDSHMPECFPVIQLSDEIARPAAG